jgi:hypothetical protein
MPQITIQANQSGNDSADATLSERVVAANLDSPHYAAQLIERLAWATADAEAIESQLRRRPPRDRRSASRARPARLVISALVLVIATALSLASVAVAHP